MSRVSLIEKLYSKKNKNALEFDYDSLWAPPIRCLLSQQDIDGLYKICTSVKYNGNINKKYELIDAIMKPRGFKRGNCGTNRVVYNFLEDTSFCYKIALDRAGLKDSPAEFKNQQYFKPFCCKIFEVDPTGVVACIERVNPISSFEEYASIAEDIFNMMVTKIIGKYVVDDLGTEYYMNYGIRYNSNGVSFGPVIIDYPYAYELDGSKLICAKEIIDKNGNRTICNGEIDYDASLSRLVCTKCGKIYTAQELSKDDSGIRFYSETPKCDCRSIVKHDRKIILDSGRSSKLYITKDEYEEVTTVFKSHNVENGITETPVSKTYRTKRKGSIKDIRREYYTELQIKAYNARNKREEKELMNNSITEVDRTIRSKNYNTFDYEEENNSLEGFTPVVATVRDWSELDDNVETSVVDERETIADTVEEVTNKEITPYEANRKENGHNDVIDALANVILAAAKSNSIDEFIAANVETENIEKFVNDTDDDISNNKCNGEVEENKMSDEEEICSSIEKDSFPEIGSALNEEPDYSNYIPDDEQDDSASNEYEDQQQDYSSYLKNDAKFNKRQSKKERNKYKKQNFDSVMNEY